MIHDRLGQIVGFITGLVAAIAFWRPGHLYEQVDELKNTANSEGFRDIIDDAIIHLVKKECLRNRKEASNGGTQSVYQ